MDIKTDEKELYKVLASTFIREVNLSKWWEVLHVSFIWKSEVEMIRTSNLEDKAWFLTTKAEFCMKTVKKYTWRRKNIMKK